jgi:hypothetical protein
MPVYAQHGYGKTDKVELGLQQGSLGGVILSPRDEKPTKLAAFVEDLQTAFEGVTVLFDPQFYASTISPVKDGNLPEYPYYQSVLTRARFVSPADLQQYVGQTLNYEMTLGLDRLVSPTIMFSDFSDPWSQIALSLAQQSIATHGQLADPPPLLLSLVMDETALRNGDALNEFLDIITAWDVEGFYIVVRRTDRGYPAYCEEIVLRNQMYLAYVLAEMNNFEVVFGYTDVLGVLLHAVGVAATGTGWHNSLRQFSLSRFQPSTGGSPPRPRYTSQTLLNSILVVPELAGIQTVGQMGNVLSGTAYDGVMVGNPANATWPPATSCLHHWEVLSDLVEDIASYATVSEKLDRVDELIVQGVATYGLLRNAGVVFEPSTGSRDLEVWLRSLRAFRQNVGL